MTEVVVDNWLTGINERRRPFRERGYPESFVDAVVNIQNIYNELRAEDRVEPLSPYYPRDSLAPRAFRHMCPPFWALKPPSGLVIDRWIEIVPSPEYEAEKAEWRREWRKTKALYAEAKKDYEMIAPIVHAEENLFNAIFLAANPWSGCEILDPRLFRVIIAYRNSLQRFSPTNPVLEDWIFKLDQMIDRFIDQVRRIMLQRLFSGELSEEQRQVFIDLLQAHADNGLWPDPEGDMAAAKAQARPTFEA